MGAELNTSTDRRTAPPESDLAINDETFFRYVDRLKQLHDFLYQEAIPVDADSQAISGMRATAASKTSSELDAMTPPQLAAEELRRDAIFSASRGFSFAALRRRILTGLPPALERRLTASP